MSNIEISLLIALIGITITAAGFFAGRKTASKAEGEEWGALKTTLAHIKDDLQELKSAVANNSKEAMSAILRESEERRSSIKRLHEKFDDHLRDCHNIAIPKS